MSAFSWVSRSYDVTAYRNIATCDPRQSLYDDLTEDGAKLDRLVQATSGIDHTGFLEMHRPFQYGCLDDDLLRIFKKENWRSGRFGDGQSFGVWYGAEDEATSVYEACYWAHRMAEDNVLPHGEIYSADRAMYLAKLQSTRTVDLTCLTKHFEKLVHPRDYSFCQKLGEKAVAKRIELFRSPSARRKVGICTLVFDPMVIKEASAMGTIHIFVRPDGSIFVQSRIDGSSNFSLNASILKNPYSVA